jgi:hypothetical protein
MYQVNEMRFTSFMKAGRYADSIKANVIEVATGLQRWTPATQVSKKKQRYYEERKAAYEAQERLKTTP